jgi:transposase
MRFVPVKSAQTQATRMLHKTRELLIKQRTMSVNALRSHLAEFGIIAAKGIGRVDELVELAEKDATLPNIARGTVKVLAGQIEDLDGSLADLENEITAAHKESGMSRLLVEVPSIGNSPQSLAAIASLIASAIVCLILACSNGDAIFLLGLA